MKIGQESVARWFNYVREKHDPWFTQSFWDTQLKSKAEIIDNLGETEFSLILPLPSFGAQVLRV